MSLNMFASVALDPFSQAVSEVLIKVNLISLFVAVGIAILVIRLLPKPVQPSVLNLERFESRQLDRLEVSEFRTLHLLVYK